MEAIGRRVSKGFVGRVGDLLRSWLRAAERLFQALVGLVFLFFTLAGASVAYSEWQAYEHTPSRGMLRLSLLAGFTVLLFLCSLYSFLKARSVKQG